MGHTFYKMTGSGNDFVFFDARESAAASELETPEVIRTVCARGTGVGADGVVFLVRTDDADVGIRYYNSDGSTASLCGNATLCTANLSAILGAVRPEGFTISTDAGVLSARIREGLPEFDLPAPRELEADYAAVAKVPGELRLGYVTAGIPHVVIQVSDVEAIDVVARGRPIRYDASFPHGTNVNFVSRGPGGLWFIRTYERGVEAETLACGTGNVAAALLLNAWGESGDETPLTTRSGQILTVRLNNCRDDGASYPSLRGEGRLVFRGELASI